MAKKKVKAKAVTKRKTVKKAAKSPQNRRQKAKRKMHPNSLANLKKGEKTEFIPGESGNPGGRPKLLTGAYTKMLAEVDEETGMTKAELIARAGFVRSVSVFPGGTAAAREIRQATEGDTVHNTVDFDIVDWSKKRQKRKQDLEEMDDEEIFD